MVPVGPVGVLNVKVAPSHIGPLLDADGVAGAPGAVIDNVGPVVVQRPDMPCTRTGYAPDPKPAK